MRGFFCATALCDDDLHVRSVPLWEQVIDAIEGIRPTAASSTTSCSSLGATGYGRFCVETGRLAGGRAVASACRRPRRRRGDGNWQRRERNWSGRRRAGPAGDRAESQRLVHEAYPAIAEGLSSARRVEVLAVFRPDQPVDRGAGRRRRALRACRAALAGGREAAAHPPYSVAAQLGRHLSRRFRAAAEECATRRAGLLDSWPRRSWLQYARLDDHLGSILRAEALADPANAAAKLEQAAELKVPAALAVDSVRHSMPMPTRGCGGRRTSPRASWRAPSPSPGSGGTPNSSASLSNITAPEEVSAPSRRGPSGGLD